MTRHRKGDDKPTSKGHGGTLSEDELLDSMPAAPDHAKNPGIDGSAAAAAQFDKDFEASRRKSLKKQKEK